VNRSLCRPEAEGTLPSRWRTTGAIMASIAPGSEAAEARGNVSEVPGREELR